MSAETPPCSECGAHSGHRMITVEPGAYRACSRGLPSVSRYELEQWQKLVQDAQTQRDAYLRQLTAVQARCTELLEENRALKAYCGAV